MHHSIKLSDEAYKAYERRASRVGLTVDEYLDRSAPSDDGFVLTPEMRAGIERGLAQADAGQLMGLNEVRESLAQYGAKWREKKSR
jgi:predicted transcriptional regulator